MSIETSNFAVERGGELYRVLGSELANKLQTGDILVVQRANRQYKYTISNPIDVTGILNDDLFACTDTNNVTYKVTGLEFKSLFTEEECVPDTDAYRDAKNASVAERSRCRLLCETDYCNSICDKMYNNNIWWAETLYLCKDPDRSKPAGWDPDGSDLFG